MVICSNNDEEKSPVISKLDLYNRAYSTLDAEKFEIYLKSHFVKENQQLSQELQCVKDVPASAVDPNG